MRRILLLGPVDISKDSGPKVHFLNLAMNFEKLGWRTRCIIYSPEDITKDKTFSKLDIKFVPNPLIGNKFKRFIKYLLIIPFMIIELHLFKPQIVYFRFSPPAFLYLLVLRLLRFFSLNYKIIVGFNDWVSEERAIQGEGEFKAKLIEFLQVRSAFFSDYVRVVAPGIKERLISHGIDSEKVTVIENGTDINHFRPVSKVEAKKELSLDPDCLYIGFIGNFVVWQGLDCLLQAIPEVLKAHKNIRFLLIGDGPLMPKIKEAVSGWKGEKVVLTGSIPYQEADLYINAFDIGVAPFVKERNDGMVSPMKIRDYAACGVPIITTKIRGLEMVNKEGIGILVPPDNSGALAKAIIKLSRDAKTRDKMGKRGRKLAEEKFSWENIAKQILKMVEN
jgi:glycosyltransferase involved in cell wall biosynthesis